MTCRQLFVLRCDHKELVNDYIKRCSKEMLGDDREDSMALKRRARKDGWTISTSNHGQVHRCPRHADLTVLSETLLSTKKAR